jgi:hypothetical protein
VGEVTAGRVALILGVDALREAFAVHPARRSVGVMGGADLCTEMATTSPLPSRNPLSHYEASRAES